MGAFFEKIAEKCRSKRESKNPFWKGAFFIYDHRYLCYRDRLGEEIQFWRDHFKAGKRLPWMELLLDPQTRKKAFPAWILPFVDQIRARREGDMAILDVGCGPLPPLAWGAEQSLFKLTAIDPLAEEYIKMHEKHNISFPFKPIKASAEYLSGIFPAENFDIVYSANALDHTVDVRKSIENMHKVLKGDGFLALEGFVREGTKQHWGGLHRHDLVPVNGELIHYDRRGHSTNVSTGFKCIFQEQDGTELGDWYRMVFTKTLSY